MSSKPGPAIITTISTDLSGLVDEWDDLRELALRACVPVTPGARLRVDLGRAKMDSRRILIRAYEAWWHQAAEIEFTGEHPDFLEQIAKSLDADD